MKENYLNFRRRFLLEDTLNFIDETNKLDFDAYHIMPYHPKLSMEMD